MAERKGRLTVPTFERDGAEHHPLLALDAVADLQNLFSVDGVIAGERLADISTIEEVVGEESPISNLVEQKIGKGARPVRAIAFDKTPSTNWSLGWHQDRTICVKDHTEVTGFGPWTTKQGMHHVQPPFAITRAMATVRIHIDRVDATNAPLKVALGTHRLGRVPDRRASEIVAQHPILECLAQPGDVWLYSTPILHASDKASGIQRRRVLQLDYSAQHLPKPLEWLLG